MRNKNKGHLHTNDFLFLFPTLAIRKEHLSKKDVKNVKSELAHKLSGVSLVVGAGLFFISLTLIIIMGFNTDWNHVDFYGLASLIGFILGVVVSFICCGFQLSALLTRETHPKYSEFAQRIGLDILFLGISAFMCLCIYSDAHMGHTTKGIALSASIILLAVLLLIQPAYWIDALVLNLSTSIAMIIVSIICSNKYGMMGLNYYILIGVAFIFVAYIVCSVLFYAETQRYYQIMQNEMLYNTALYDELTKCKNRFALKEFLKENKKKWENRGVNLLFIIFDIDNFKEYNDQYSHTAGDFCLVSIADAIRREFPSPGLDFFRYGGEEFLLFFEMRNPNDSKTIMEQVRETIKELNIASPEGAPAEAVTVSVGGSLFQTQGSFDFDEAFRTVDSYLYKAKSSGKDACCFNGKIISKNG